MGREIRKVIPNWEHPRQDCPHSPWKGGCDDAHANGGKCLTPLRDESYESAAAEWLKSLLAWEAGDDPDREKYGYRYYWDWNGSPPNKESYRPEWTKEPTWFQVYETVSEGTPVTPPFATKEELVDYLVTNGDFWDQLRGDGGWSRENAEQFVGRGFAMSMVAISTPEGVEIKMPRDGQFT